jgi:Family of unknown function (DUF6928)
MEQSVGAKAGILALGDQDFTQSVRRLGFYPLDLGQQAMRFLVGFALEGLPEPDDVNAAQISMLGYRVTDPTGAEQAALEAALREFMRQTSRRRYRIGPAGSLEEIDGNLA